MIKFQVNTGVTPISNIFIEEYMPKAKSPVFSTIYIYGLKCAVSGEQIENAEIADKLDILESDVIRAWEYWEKCGVIALEKNEKDYSIEFLDLNKGIKEAAAINEPILTETKPQPIKPTYTSEDINELLKVNPEIGQIVQAAEQIYAKPFTPSDLSTVVGFYQWLGLSAEVIMYLFGHCRGKSMRYIEKTACDWADKGISTCEEAEEYINTHYNNYHDIMNAFGIGARNPGEKERNFMDDWLFKLKMPLDLIKLACDRTLLKTGKVAWEYADGIIKDWYKKGLKTIAEVNATDLAFIKKKAENKEIRTNNANVKNTSAQRPVAQTKFVNYNQPVYTDEEIEAAIRRKKQRRNAEK